MPSRKSFTPGEFKLSETGEVVVAFAQLNVIDRDGDVTLPGAFPAKAVPMSAYGHTSWDGELPVGKGLISEAGDWAIFTGSFFMDTAQGRNAHATVKAMADLQEWSYGYEPVVADYGQRDGRSVRLLKSIDVFEVSPVLLGAGVGTHTLAIKSGAPGADAPYAEHLDRVLDEVKALVDRSRDRAAWRAKEGRGLSGSNLVSLGDLRDGLYAVTADLDDLLEPPKRYADPATVEALLGLARTAGVIVS
jgi:hypothetical protein